MSIKGCELPDPGGGYHRTTPSTVIGLFILLRIALVAVNNVIWILTQPE